MSLTHVELTNSGACAIRGKLTWPSVVWFGRDAESFLLVSERKSRLLDTGDGSISRHIPLVDRLISESIKIASSREGMCYGNRD